MFFRSLRSTLVVVAVGALFAPRIFSQDPPPPPNPAFAQPSNFSPEQLDELVSRIALYPDPLLAQVFAAATYPDQLADAAAWADQHHYLSGDALAQAINGDQLPFHPSVQALLPFPSVLQMMVGDMNWTLSLGNAVLSQNEALQDAVQRMRHRAYDLGYLRTGNAQFTYSNGPYIEILPVDPGYICIPYYDPAVVFYRPWRGRGVGISFGFGVRIGGYFAPWGWGGGRVDWGHHTIFMNNQPWARRWENRDGFQHPYPGVRVRPWTGPAPSGVPRQDPHRLTPRTPVERQRAEMGRKPFEQHRQPATPARRNK